MKKKIWFMILGILIGVILVYFIVSFLDYQQRMKPIHDPKTKPTMIIIEGDTLHFSTYKEMKKILLDYENQQDSVKINKKDKHYKLLR